MKKLLIIIFFLIIIPLALFMMSASKKADSSYTPLWNFQSVDTMKFSRDVSREKLNDSTFDKTITSQVRAIADMGATHVGIATPYDEEFVPILNRWVGVARQQGLKVWFRGNWSGWEGWFGYPKIDRATHIVKSREFILNHPELFKDGDVFSACPECENGGPGDPRLTRDVKEYRQFLIDENTAMKSAFKQLGKNVNINYNSMNGDVARLVMDQETTKALGGVVVIDHYVRTPDQLAKDVQDIAQNSGGNVILGEFGVPILDINGQMTEDEQSEWVKDALSRLVAVPELKGLNYWVNLGGSTSLYNQDGKARKVVDTLASFYKPAVSSLYVVDPLGDNVANVTVTTLNRSFAKESTLLPVPVVEQNQRATVRAEGYGTKYITLSPSDGELTIILDPKKENLLYTLRKLLRFVFRI